MPESLPVKIAQESVLEGRHPIVMIGPNGSGKTRHGAAIAGWNNADMIGALRNIDMGVNVSMQPIQQASTSLRQTLQRRRSRPWELSNEIGQLFSKLMAEDSAEAIRFRDEFSRDKSTTPKETKLMRLAAAWSRLFPGRRIDFSGYSPQVESDYSGGGATYAAQQMSDGERVALYLAARVIDADSPIIIVDEPEVHFHSRLAVRFWNELEGVRSDCRFVYITHDLPFALSRSGAQYVIVRPNLTHEPVELADELPEGIAESLLAAASFSIHAQRIVFCEGSEGASRDQVLYGAWFSSRDTAVVPVGSSRDVLRCTRAFSESRLVAGVAAIGVIDRDYWPDSFLDSLPASVSVLPYHEIENLFCAREVFLAVAKHLSIDPDNAKKRYEEFLEAAVGIFIGGVLNKQISERFRRRCEHQFQAVLNNLEVGEDLAAMRSGHCEALDPESWGLRPDNLLSEETETVERALCDRGPEFLRLLPGKAFLRHAADKLGMNVDAYVSLVSSSLNAPPGSAQAGLRADLEGFLDGMLPPRTIESVV